MDALTPAGAGLGGAWPIGPSCHRQVSLLHVTESSGRSVSNHPWPPPEIGLLSLRGLPHVRRRLRPDIPVPVGRIVIWASPFPSRLAAATGRIEFVSLRTSRSPPVALHPVSRRRSYRWLQSPDRTLAGTFTLPIPCARRRTRTGFQPVHCLAQSLQKADPDRLEACPTRLLGQTLSNCFALSG